MRSSGFQTTNGNPDLSPSGQGLLRALIDRVLLIMLLVMTVFVAIRGVSSPGSSDPKGELQVKFISEARNRLIGFWRNHAPGAHLLGWQVSGVGDEIRLVLEHRGTGPKSGDPIWRDVLMVIQRKECSNLFVARADEPVPIPPAADDRNGWGRWLADPRVSLRLWEPEKTHQNLTPGCTAPTKVLNGNLPRSGGLWTPVDSFSDR